MARHLLILYYATTIFFFFLFFFENSCSYFLLTLKCSAKTMKSEANKLVEGKHWKKKRKKKEIKTNMPHLVSPLHQTRIFLMISRISVGKTGYKREVICIGCLKKCFKLRKRQSWKGWGGGDIPFEFHVHRCQPHSF